MRANEKCRGLRRLAFGCGLALLVSLCAACRAHRAPEDERFRLEVEAPSPELQAAITETTTRIITEMEREFGVQGGALRVVVDLDPEDSRGGFTSSRGMTILPLGLTNLVGLIAHESAHWLLHWRHSYWNTLPIVVEEGFAHQAFHHYSDVEIPFHEARLDMVSFLSLSLEEFNSQEDTRPATYTGVLIVHLLGVERLRELALRAHRIGVPTIPPRWILAALHEVHPEECVPPQGAP